MPRAALRRAGIAAGLIGGVIAAVIVAKQGGGAPTTTLTLAIADNVSGAAPAGNALTFTITPSNTGSIDATTVSCAITVDSSLTIGSPSGTGWSCGTAGHVVTCTRATITHGTSPTFTIPVTAGNSNVTAHTTGALTASDASTATASHDVTVSKLTTTVAATDSADPVITGGDAFSYTITAHNSDATGQLDNLSLAFTLDASLGYVSSSGTGWSCGQSGGVVTCTRSTLAANSDAPAITVSVTTGGSGVSASSSAQLTSDNGATSTGSQGTTVNLVTKDATLGWYFPNSSTEWTNFIARKGLAMSVPDHLWLMQEASGNLADSIGSMTMTANASPAYQQTLTGVSRKGVQFTDNTANQRFGAAASSGDNVSTTSVLYVWFVKAGTASGTHIAGAVDTSTFEGLQLATGALRLSVNSVTATTANTNYPSKALFPLALGNDRANSANALWTDAEKLSVTYFSIAADGIKSIGSPNATGVAPLTTVYGFGLVGAHAENQNANLKATLQAMGVTIGW